MKRAWISATTSTILHLLRCSLCFLRRVCRGT
jgi:hypothetical protein